MNGEQIEAYLREEWPRIAQNIQALIRIPSVSAQAEGPYPFGTPCAKALEAALHMGQAMGFDTENDDYYGGSILFHGEGKGEIGMFAHLDVVPAGEGWLHPPFEPRIEEGWLYGRGSADDKGPAVVALHAMDCIRRAGIVPRHRIRLFLGCSEERGMEDIRHFCRIHPAPDFSFTPDGSFSVCYAEKGIISAWLSAKLPEEILSFEAGVAENAVAAGARAVLRDGGGVLPPCVEGVSLRRDAGVIVAEATGRAAHAAFPEGSVNAAVRLSTFLTKSGLLTAQGARALLLLAERFGDYDGGSLGIAFNGEETGKLTVVAGMTRTRDGRICQSVNVRYPAQMPAGRIEAALCDAARAYGWRVDAFDDDPPAYVNPDQPVIREMNRICAEVIDPAMRPYTMGGGTYARHLPNAVAYGPAIRGMKKPGPDGHGGGHQPDECVSVNVLQDALRVYVRALLAVDRLVP